MTLRLVVKYERVELRHKRVHVIERFPHVTTVTDDQMGQKSGWAMPRTGQGAGIDQTTKDAIAPAQSGDLYVYVLLRFHWRLDG